MVLTFCEAVFPRLLSTHLGLRASRVSRAPPDWEGLQALSGPAKVCRALGSKPRKDHARIVSGRDVL